MNNHFSHGISQQSFVINTLKSHVQTTLRCQLKGYVDGANQTDLRFLMKGRKMRVIFQLP